MDSLVAAAVCLSEKVQSPSEQRGFQVGKALEELAPPDRALVSLGRLLLGEGYAFTTITPLSHRRVSHRKQSETNCLADIFGWSRPFRRRDVPQAVLSRLDEAGALEGGGSHLRSAVRFSTLEDQIFVHSAFPTDEADAVFFGPDTYRFARLGRQTLQSLSPRGAIRLLDVGAGSGAGGLYAAKLLGHGASLVLSDVNCKALRYCRINAVLNSVSSVEVVESDLFQNVTGSFDLIIANPPYLVDSRARFYRHGGGQFGEGLSLRIAAEGIDRLAPGGRLILYTGTAIVAGVDRLKAMLQSMLAGRSLRLSYEEIDPDVFGEELEHAPYDRADRIAVVAAIIEAPNRHRGHP